MIRILNAEIYKLKKSKSFYICSIVMICFVLLLYGLLYLADSIQKGTVENGTGGFFFVANGEGAKGGATIFESFSLMEALRQIFAGSMLSCMLAIFVSIFVTGEYGSGMIKNVVGKGCSRSAIYLSKLFMAQVASLCIAFAGILPTLLLGRVFLGAQAFDGGFWHDFMIYTGLQLAIMAATSAIFMLVSEVCRTPAAGISINIGMIIFSLLFINGLDVLFAKNGFSLSDIWPIGQTERLPLNGFTSGMVIQNLLVAAAWFLAAASFGVWHFSKTDVK